jgi:hypothetical protein
MLMDAIVQSVQNAAQAYVPAIHVFHPVLQLKVLAHIKTFVIVQVVVNVCLDIV